MADALDVLNNLLAMDIEAIASAALEEKEEVIADLMATQLSQGKRADGTEILPSYKPLTIQIKEETGVGLGAVTDRTTLFSKGDFYKGLYADVKGQIIEYGSKDKKSENLEKKYSTSKGSVFGLNEDSRDELVEGGLRSSFVSKVETITGL